VDPSAILVDNHRAFLRYLERRLGDRALAEDILQDAFSRNLGRLDEVPEAALVPWFYRVLRNASIDRTRRRGSEARALAAFAAELEGAAIAPPDVREAICGCVGRLAETLKPEYRDAIVAVDVHETPVKAFAAATGLTPSAAGVRVFRARAALRQRVVESCGTCAEHGCRDCSCQAQVAV
jgi:RNA polymerase sigma-70 factor (ECF subfamily)